VRILKIFNEWNTSKQERKKERKKEGRKERNK